MNAPYVPGSGLWAGLARRWARVAARTPLKIGTDHAIVTFTFDDFPKSAVTAGGGALEKRNWRGTYYASAGYAGGHTHHGAMFDAGDLLTLDRKGHEIACHTYGHVDAAAIRTADLIKDVARNARALEAMGLETPLESFAFAYGEATPAANPRCWSGSPICGACRPASIAAPPIWACSRRFRSMVAKPASPAPWTPPRRWRPIPAG